MSAETRQRYLEVVPRADGWRARDHTPRGTLVLLHAFPLSARMWQPQEALAAQGWHIVLPHLRGFDDSDDSISDETASSIDDYAQDVANLMGSLGVASAVIGGLSMGGYVALALYRRAPHLFRALVLADTRADADTPEARANRQRLITLADTAGSSGIADDMIPKLLGPTTQAAQPALVESVRALIRSQQPAALKSALHAMMTRPDSIQTAKAIDAPVLVLAGAEDSLTPPSVGSAMADTIRGAAFAVIPEAGHLSSLEQPRAFNAAVRQFLDRL